MKLTRPISLVGMMGAGKTSFGRKIAKKLKAEFFDLDNEIKLKTGYSPKEIFNYFGKELLEDTEFAVLKELLNNPHSIIATGDTTIDNKKVWAYLKENTITLWLNIDLKLISVRLKPNEDRPYLEAMHSQGMLKFITQLYHKRAKTYKEAHITIHKPILNKRTFLQKLANAIQKLQIEGKIELDEELAGFVVANTAKTTANRNKQSKTNKNIKYKNQKKSSKTNQAIIPNQTEDFLKAKKPEKNKLANM